MYAIMGGQAWSELPAGAADQSNMADLKSPGASSLESSLNSSWPHDKVFFPDTSDSSPKGSGSGADLMEPTPTPTPSAGLSRTPMEHMHRPHSGIRSRPSSGIRPSSGKTVWLETSQVRAVVADPVTLLLHQLHKIIYITLLPPVSRANTEGGIADDRARLVVDRYKRALFSPRSTTGTLRPELALKAELKLLAEGSDKVIPVDFSSISDGTSNPSLSYFVLILKACSSGLCRIKHYAVTMRYVWTRPRLDLLCSVCSLIAQVHFGASTCGPSARTAWRWTNSTSHCTVPLSTAISAFLAIFPF